MPIVGENHHGGCYVSHRERMCVHNLYTRTAYVYKKIILTSNSWKHTCETNKGKLINLFLVLVLVHPKFSTYGSNNFEFHPPT